MKVFNRLICMLLSAVMLLYISSPVMALDYGLSSNNNQTTSMVDLREQLYEEHIVPLPNNALRMQNSEDERLQRILAAENYVQSMNISEDLKTDCLDELESFKNDETCYLEAYSVYIPMARSSEAYFGTYKNVDFYMKWVSHSTKTYSRETTSSQRTLNAWKTGTLNLALEFVSSAYSGVGTVWFAWSIIEPFFGSNYSIQDSDFAEHYASVDSDFVKTYVLENNSYTAVHGLDYGYIEPYVVYHTTNKIGGSYTHEAVQEKIECGMPKTADILINSYAGYQSRYFQNLIGNQLDWKWA